MLFDFLPSLPYLGEIGSRGGLGASLLTALKFVNVIVGAIENSTGHEIVVTSNIP